MLVNVYDITVGQSCTFTTYTAAVDSFPWNKSSNDSSRRKVGTMNSNQRRWETCEKVLSFKCAFLYFDTLFSTVSKPENAAWFSLRRALMNARLAHRAAFFVVGSIFTFKEPNNSTVLFIPKQAHVWKILFTFKFLVNIFVFVKYNAFYPKALSIASNLFTAKVQTLRSCLNIHFAY